MEAPAFCDDCGAVFRSGIVVEDSAPTLAGNRAGTCPVCGGTGRIPDGLLSFVGNTIEILSVPQRTIDELSRLAQILYAARAEQQSPDDIADTIRQEMPALSGLAEILPKTRSELHGFVALIAAVVFLLIQASQNSEDTINVTVDQAVNQVFIETDKTAVAKQRQMQQGGSNVRRNEPCPCGSGKKHKRCCGTIR